MIIKALVRAVAKANIRSGKKAFTSARSADMPNLHRGGAILASVPFVGNRIGGLNASGVPNGDG